VLAIGLLDFSLEQTIVVPALTAIEGHYHASASAVTWILTAFLLAAAVSTPLAGRLGDRHGKRLVLLVSLALFGAGSVVCALGGSIGMVIAGRVIQGLGGGVGPLAVALARDHLPHESVGRAVGLLVGFGGAGGVVGFLACGLLTKYVSVPSIFWFTAATAGACLISVWLTVKETTVRAHDRIDWLGGALLAGGLAALLLAISEGNTWHWGSARVIAILSGSIALLGAFVAREQTAGSPLIDLAALRGRSLAGANTAVFAVGYALLVSYAVVPLIAGLPKSTGYGLGLSTIQLSFVLAPSAVGALIGGIAGGRLVALLGAHRVATLGAACGVVSYVAFLTLPWTVPVLIGAMLPIGFGTSVAIVATTGLTVLAAPVEQTGIAVGLNSVVRAVGSALGAQVAVAIFTAAPQLAPGVPESAGADRVFVMALIATAITVVAVRAVPRRESDPTVLSAAQAG
jgi:MFS family permease